MVDREFAEIDAFGLDATVAEGLDKQADRAAGVKGGLGVEVLDQAVGDLAKEIEPERVSLVADSRGGVVAVVLGAVVGRDGPLARGGCLAPTRRRLLFDRIR